MISPLVVLGLGAGWAIIVRDHLSTPFDPVFDKIGKMRDVPSNLLRAIARVESGFNATAVSPVNANNTRDYGLMQINERTALGLGISPPTKLLGNPELSVDAAARVLLDMRRFLGERYSPHAWVMSYNVGPDLEPRATGEAYAAKVMYHWNLYDLGRVFA